MSDRLSPQREAEIQTAVAVYTNHPMIGFNCCSAHPAADAVPELLAELAAVRAELAHAVPHAREEALKWAANLVADHVPDDVHARIWDAAQADQRAANAVLDQQQGVAR